MTTNCIEKTIYNTEHSDFDAIVIGNAVKHCAVIVASSHFC